MVTLCNLTEEGEESCYPFWPTTEGEEVKVKYGKIIISHKSQTSYDQFVVRKFLLNEDRVW